MARNRVQIRANTLFEPTFLPVTLVKHQLQ